MMRSFLSIAVLHGLLAANDGNVLKIDRISWCRIESIYAGIAVDSSAVAWAACGKMVKTEWIVKNRSV